MQSKGCYGNSKEDWNLIKGRSNWDGPERINITFISKGIEMGKLAEESGKMLRSMDDIARFYLPVWLGYMIYKEEW